MLSEILAKLGAQILHSVLDFQCRVTGALRSLLDGDWCAEERHNAVSGEVADASAMMLDNPLLLGGQAADELICGLLPHALG
nr:hypothetical protein [Mesorhizobium sp.]